MAVNVARIYEQTIRPGNNYCRICLRSSSETTLITPRNLIQFTNSLKLKVFDGKKALSACYVCEAIAGTAMKMYQACVNAVSIRNVCQPLKNMKDDDPVPEWLRAAILGCNANLKEYRQRSTLQQTEVLVVDSVGIEWQQDRNSEKCTKIVPPPVISDSTKEQYETVILDDDDEPQTSAAHTQTGPTQNILTTNQAVALVPNQMQILAKQSDNSYVLHPLIIQDGKLVAPSLAGHVKDGELLLLDTATGIGKHQETKHAIQNFAIGRGDNNSYNNQIINKSSQERNFRSRSQQCIQSNAETESVLRRYLNDEGEKGNNPISAKRKKDDSVNNFTNSSDSDPIAIISNVMTGECLRDEEMGVVKEVLTRAPGLVEKSGKIDWEDKIPMDVISFVDATDPNLIVPDPSPVCLTRLENVKPIVKDNIIDLC